MSQYGGGDNGGGGVASCQQVPRQTCDQVAKTVPVSVPRQQCQAVEREVPSQQCRQVPRQVCQSVPRQNCQSVPVRIPRQQRTRKQRRVCEVANPCGNTGSGGGNTIRVNGGLLGLGLLPGLGGANNPAPSNGGGGNAGADCGGTGGARPQYAAPSSGGQTRPSYNPPSI